MRSLAELVAAILKVGGLMDSTSNPGSATPETLFRTYKDRAAVTANPYVLRGMQNASGLSFATTVGTSVRDALSEQAAERESLLQQRAIMAPMPTLRPAQHTIGERRRTDSPPRGHFKVITHCGATPFRQTPQTHNFQNNQRAPMLTLNSLDMSKRGQP